MSHLCGRRAVGRDTASRQIHLVELAMGGKGWCAIFELQSIYVNGPVRRLSCNKFVERIPSDTLNKMAMFCYLSDHSSWANQLPSFERGWSTYLCVR